ncbi:MAG: sulfur carrier protein ThiS [Myxococcota bacterium]
MTTMTDSDPGASAPLSITVNGDPATVEAGCPVRRLVERLGLGDRRVAVAINREVVPRASYDRALISEGDRIEILEAVGGG